MWSKFFKLSNSSGRTLQVREDEIWIYQMD